MAKGDPSPEDVLAEGIVFWIFALLFFIGRLWSRVITSGSIKRFAWDDYVMCATFFFYTALIVLLQFNIRYASNLMDQSELRAVLANPEGVKNRIFGSKITLAVEQCMIHAQWGTKASLLILYHRMTQGLRENLFNKIVAGYVVFAYLVIQITFFGVWCRPFNQYWALPPDNPQCANYGHYCITILVFNTSTDILIFLIPIPLIWKAQMKRKKKLMLCAVFSLGIFNVIAAVLNKLYNWILPGSLVYMIWYVRESSTGIYVANATCCWPLFRKVLAAAGCGGSWTNSRSRSRSRSRRRRTLRVGGGYKTDNRASSHLAIKHMRDEPAHSLHSGSTNAGVAPDDDDNALYSHRGRDCISPSQEAINDQTHHVPLEIWRQVDYDVEPGLATEDGEYEGTAYGMEEKGGHAAAFRHDVLMTTVTEVRAGVAHDHRGRGQEKAESRSRTPSL